MNASLAQRAKTANAAALKLSHLKGSLRDAGLEAMAKALEAGTERILEANARDMARAEALVEKNQMTRAALKRLMLDPSKVRGMAQGILSVRSLEDPLGRTLATTELDRGLVLYKVSVPIGVIGVVFESRPDVVPQIASLCLKSGNAVILKGGSEALASNKVLGEILSESSIQANIPEGWLQVIETREEVLEILSLHEDIDLVIPRGSNAFVQYVMDHTKIPVLGHSDGICHLYIDRGAEVEMACQLAKDAKCQYPAVCNAIETLLVDAAGAERLLPPIAKVLLEAGVALRGDEKTRQILAGLPVAAATEEDWKTEYLDLILSIRVVSGIDEAIAHINAFGSHHTDAIVTADGSAAKKFLREVDSSSVMHNASTRFADGFRYGLGAEIGISTNKIHSRGPVGLEGLVIYKYILEGQGQPVAAFVGDSAKPYTHRPLNQPWFGE